MQKLDDEDREKLKNMLNQMRVALDRMEKGMNHEDILDQYRACDMIVALAKHFELAIELQDDAVRNTVNYMREKSH